MNEELVCVMASLGYAEGDEYYKGVDCLASLKDMIKFLRYDSKSFEIRRQMGGAKVLCMDLLPLLVHHGEDRDLADIIMRLIVNLTSPVAVCVPNLVEGEASTLERESHIIKITSHLQQYKEAFTDQKVMAAIAGLIAEVLKLGWEERQEEDTLFLERILLTLRNILHVPADREAEKRTDDDVSIHDQVLWNIHINGIDDLLLYILSSPDEQQWSFHALEIICCMLREQNPEKLAFAGEARSETERNEDSKILDALIQAEMEEKKAKIKKFSSRHSNFGGSFWVPDVKALNKDNPLVYHRPLGGAKKLSLDFDKELAKERKAKRAAVDRNPDRESILSIRLFLKGFCRKFLEHCYNPLMEFVKDKLASKKTQENDETYYLWCIRFFMAFNRSLGFGVEYVGATFNLREFEYVLNLLHSYYEMYALKRSQPEWSRRLHIAIQAYKELLLTLFTMQKSKNPAHQASAKVIQSNIFYVEEYRTVFLELLKKYNKAKLPRSALRDMIEAFHVFLKMLDKFAGDKELLVEQKKKQRKAKKKKEQKKAIGQEEKQKLWDDLLGSALSGLLQGRDGEEVKEGETSPFDPLSEVPVEEQIDLTKHKIQDILLNKQYNEAVALLRAAREVWSDHADFGKSEMTSEEEFMCLREIFFAELPDHLVDHDGEIEEEEEAVDEIRNEVRTEKSFTLKSFLARLVDSSVIEPYIYLLGFYKENSEHTNHCIVKLLHRVAVDLKTPAMFFQLSVFIVFKKILFDRISEHYRELKKFATFIMSKFFELVPEKPMIFVEVVSWKSPKECYELIEGYGSLDNKAEKKRVKWSFEEEQELMDLYKKFQDHEDVLSQIMSHITDKQRTERQIVRNLVRLRMVPNARALTRPKKFAWNSEKDEELRNVFQEFRESDDPLGNTMSSLSFFISKQKVSKRLLELNVVTDRKEMHKKRKSRQNKKRQSGSENFEDMAMEYLADYHSDPEMNFELPVLAEEHSSGSSHSEREAFSDTEEDEEEDSLSEHEDNSNISVETKCNKFLRACHAAVSRELDETFFRAFLKDFQIENLKKCLEQQLKWFQKKLLAVADDRENQEEWLSIPLVTITLDQQKAFKVKEFKRVLKTAGIRPPKGHEETFWRIPSDLSPSNLKELIKIIDEIATCKEHTADSVQKQQQILGEPEVEGEVLVSKENELEKENDLLNCNAAVVEDDKFAADGEATNSLQSDNSDEEAMVPACRRSRKRNRALSDNNDSESEDDISLAVLSKKRHRNDFTNDNSLAEKELILSGDSNDQELEDTSLAIEQSITKTEAGEQTESSAVPNSCSLDLKLSQDKESDSGLQEGEEF